MSRDFNGFRVTILGLGIFTGGAASARYCAIRGAEVTVTDLQSEQALRKSIESLSEWPIRYVLGEHHEKDITDADLVVVGPAVHDESPFLRLAMERNVPLTTEMNLVFEECNRPIIGITGSNGKTTTTSLIAALFRSVYPATLEGGNIGRSVLNELNSEVFSEEGIGRKKFTSSEPLRLDAESKSEFPVVLEMSSFQLHRLAWIRRSPTVAVVTNLSPNHLDWHGTFEAYEEAKQHIVRYQSKDDLAVLNADDYRLRRWGNFCPGQVVWFSKEKPVKIGCYLRDGMVVYRNTEGERTVCPADSLRLPGPHNQANLLAAVTVACHHGIPSSVIQSTVEAFEGVEHRLEKVGKFNGVDYYNDSACTTPESTVTALRAIDKDVVLIAGGYDKGMAFHNMAEEVIRRTIAVVLIGMTGDKIESTIRQKKTTGKPLTARAETLEEAVLLSADLAHPGDVVIMSPGCASYDMFTNFEERGKRFKAAVMKLEETNNDTQSSKLSSRN